MEMFSALQEPFSVNPFEIYFCLAPYKPLQNLEFFKQVPNRHATHFR